MKLYTLLLAFMAAFPLLFSQGEDPLEAFGPDPFLSAQDAEVAQNKDGSNLVGWSLFKSKSADTYVINFNEISIVEYLRFVSKIADVNFLFEEAELNFTVTIVSAEPLSVPNIVSALIQTLRARGFSLLEQEGNLLITQSPNINQIPTIMTKANQKEAKKAPIVTRVFRLKNASLASVASIIRPMMSQSAMVEASNETRQLIVTDITTNVEKIATLIDLIDVPHSTLEIDVYQARHLSSDELISMAKTITMPFAKDQPLIFVNQEKTQSVFVVSTPYLVEKAIEVMEDLDTSPTTSKGRVSGDPFLYKIIHQDDKILIKGLKKIGKELEKTGSLSLNLINAIDSVQWIEDSNSLLFITDPQAKGRLESILTILDVPQADSLPFKHFWLYTPEHLNGSELEEALNDIEDGLNVSGLTDQNLLRAVRSMKWIPSTSTLLFTGDSSSLGQIESMIKKIDQPQKVTAQAQSARILIYRPQYISYEQIEDTLDELTDQLNHKDSSDRALALAIDNMAWIRESQLFLFRADPQTIERLEGFLKEIDNPQEAETIAQAYFLYRLQYARGDDVLDFLENIANNLPEKDPLQRAIVRVIDHASYLKDTNSILLTGTKRAVEEVKTLVGQFDIEGSTSTSFGKDSFLIYKPKHTTPWELKEGLKQTAQDLKKSGLIDPNLLQAIDTMQIVELTESLIFTGTAKSLQKTQEIIETIDTDQTHGDLEQIEGETFLIYKVHYLSATELLAQLENVVRKVKKGPDTPRNKALIAAIRSAKEIEQTNSILFTGQPHALEKISSLLKQIDTPEGEDTPKGRSPGQYVIYKPKNLSGPELIDLMYDFEKNLSASGVSEPGVFETIDNLKYIEKTGYILVSGTQEGIDKVVELLKKFDSADTPGLTSVGGLDTSFLVYKLQYHPGDELQEALKQIGQDLSKERPQGKNVLDTINSIQWVKMTNSLLATGTPKILTQVKELIQNLDTPLRQVFIEVLIIRTRIVNNQQFGLQWGGKIQYLNRFAGGVSNFPSPPPGGLANTALAAPLAAVNATRTPLAIDIPNPSTVASAIPGGFDLGVIGDIILHRGRTFLSLASLVNALQSDEDSIIVMNPKIVAQDNQQSTIFVGQNIPFTGSLVSTQQGGGTQIQSNIEYRDVGTNLTITPYLGGSETVTLDISNEITEQVANTATTAQIQGIQTSRTSLNARVHIPNKHFVALSGMISDTKTHFRSGIPCLGGLPVIGAIFSENDRLNSRDNLIFFIRPVIIDSVEEYDQITENQKCLYKERASKQVIKEEIDDAIDWVEDAEFYCD